MLLLICEHEWMISSHLCKCTHKLITLTCKSKTSLWSMAYLGFGGLYYQAYMMDSIGRNVYGICKLISKYIEYHLPSIPCWLGWVGWLVINTNNSNPCINHLTIYLLTQESFNNMDWLTPSMDEYFHAQWSADDYTILFKLQRKFIPNVIMISNTYSYWGECI